MTGLDDDLSEKEWTVFAPTDSAFDLLGSANLDFLTNSDNNGTDALTSLLLFHVVPGEAIATTDLECSAGINLLTMANGGQSRTLCVGGVPTYQKGASNLRDGAPAFVTKNIETCNGIIHVLDKVLLDTPLPFETDVDDVEEEVASTPTTETEEEEADMVDAVEAVTPTAPPIDEDDGDCQSIVELACGLGTFTVLCDLMETLDLTETLSNGTWTVFAPTDEALEAADLPEDDADALLNVLLFHAIPNEVLLLDDLTCTETYEMANGEVSRTVCDGDVVRRATYQKGAGNRAETKPEIIQADVLACNGT